MTFFPCMQQRFSCISAGKEVYYGVVILVRKKIPWNNFQQKIFSISTGFPVKSVYFSCFPASFFPYSPPAATGQRVQMRSRQNKFRKPENPFFSSCCRNLSKTEIALKMRKSSGIRHANARYSGDSTEPLRKSPQQSCIRHSMWFSPGNPRHSVIFLFFLHPFCNINIRLWAGTDLLRMPVWSADPADFDKNIHFKR